LNFNEKNLNFLDATESIYVVDLGDSI
jgi:hypothetical protein